MTAAVIVVIRTVNKTRGFEPRMRRRGQPQRHEQQGGDLHPTTDDATDSHEFSH